MTGLDPDKHVILEIAAVVTDEQLKIVAEGPEVVINHPPDALRSMDEWSRNQHGSSGLLERAKESPYNNQQAEQILTDFIASNCEKGKSPLCGNSIWQDRRFLIRHMPKLESFLHYRNIDVSSIKELAKRWYPSLPSFIKEKSHLAMDDIKESIDELIYYRQKVFKKAV
jgi:oligoribonuclease